jgi:hypothetical protein
MSFIQRLWAEVSPQAHRPLEVDVEQGMHLSEYQAIKYKVTFPEHKDVEIPCWKGTDEHKTHIIWELALPTDKNIAKANLELVHEVKTDDVTLKLDGVETSAKKKLNEVGNGIKITIKHLNNRIDIFIDALDSKKAEYSLKINHLPLRLQYQSLQ